MENLGDEELDEMLSRDEQTVRSRRVSISLGNRGPDVPVPTVFTAKHNRLVLNSALFSVLNAETRTEQHQEARFEISLQLNIV